MGTKSQSKNEATIKTGIDALDKMLGGGMPAKSTVLLRGAPGSGKTTLALQIINNFLEIASKGKPDDKKQEAVFISLEKDPDEVIEHFKKSYGEVSKYIPDIPDLPHFFKIKREDVERELQKTLFKKIIIELIIAGIFITLVGLIAGIVIAVAVTISIFIYGLFVPELLKTRRFKKKILARFIANIIKKEKRKKLSRTSKITAILNDFTNLIKEKILCALAKLFNSNNTKKEEDKKTSEGKKTLIVIDSLNIFADIVLKALLGKYPSKDIREALNIICDTSQDYYKDAVTMFIAEHDLLNPKSASIASESYFCDIDIQLTKEPVIDEAAMSQRRMGIPERYKEREFLGSRKRLEERYFCRVLKSRHGPNQARRCSYEILKKKGLKFHETYPGDGQIMLYAENAAQRTEWEAFIMRDVSQMYSYPALDFRIFDRSGQQSVFTSLRRFLHIPEQTDMYLSSFDTYWVNWHVELWQRIDLINYLSEKPMLPCKKTDEEKVRARFWQIVGRTHREYVEYINELNLSKKSLKNEKILNERVNIIVDKIVSDNILCKCDACQSRRNDCINQLKDKIKSAYKHMNKEKEQCGLLHLIKDENLRLFGERKSKIISELDPKEQKDTRPIHRPYHRPYRSRAVDKVFAVPYNANISFVVYRKDLLDTLREKVEKNEFLEKVRKKHSEIEGKIEETILQNKKIPEKNITLAIEKLFGSFKEKSYVPQTWEEVIALCEIAEEKLKREYKFLIETQTFDTFTATLLEFIWSCGGKNFKVLQDYEVENKEEMLEQLFRAYYLLYLMFNNEIIPRDCSLEPEVFAERYPSASPQKNKSGTESDWLFARHWYSTFTDILTFKRSVEGARQDFVWNPGHDVELDIMPIPVSLSWYIEQNCKPEHFSCWGEWYLGILKGTENEDLAVDLINNLMSSQKIRERAFSCAALPTVEDFYERYGSSGCFNLPERESKLLPKKAYNYIRKELFEKAKSRTDIFDYQHTIQELHSVLEYVRMSESIEPHELMQEINAAINRIKSIGSNEILHF
ncbi:MAG: extracellular solute-binding protein [Sedimentisphaerales bacterium]|nr:extracellular solute-binding protein [Sedimentisphaerales bacterium]